MVISLTVFNFVTLWVISIPKILCLKEYVTKQETSNSTMSEKFSFKLFKIVTLHVCTTEF